MEKLRAFFLFRRESPEGGKKKALFWLWNLVPPVAVAAIIGLFGLYFATGRLGRDMFWSYFQNGWILLLNVLPVIWLALFLWLASGRAWIGVLTASVPALALCWVNYFKLAFRNDPLLFEDILLIREAGAMTANYRLFLTRAMVLTVLFLLLSCAVLFLFARARLNRRVRLGGLLCLLLLLLPLVRVYSSPNTYQTRTANNEHISIWSATEVYLSKGFFYPFLYSAFSTPAHSVRPIQPDDSGGADTPPQYDEAYGERVLSAYRTDDIPDARKVSVIGIMLEAFQDFSKFGTPELAFDLYAPYHALEAEGISGNLITNIFAGGTVDSERAFLTGFENFGSLRVPTNSYVWYFRDQGYTTEGMHPCFDWFYNRVNINEYLGFERYYFVENYFAPLTNGDVGFDTVFFPELKKSYLSNLETGKPYFNFSVTYQGHGPYTQDRCWWGDKGDFVKEHSYTSEQQYILDNYFGSIDDTIRHIVDLTDLLRAQDDPVVLVLFGDHNPWLGDLNSVYDAIGVDLDLSTEQGFLNYYSTRYLIWANPAARACLGGEWVGVGPDLGPYFLMNEVFRRCDWGGPAFMKVAAAAEARVPVLHTTGVFMENGALTETLSPEGQAVVNDYLYAQDYWKRKAVTSAPTTP